MVISSSESFNAPSRMRRATSGQLTPLENLLCIYMNI